MPLPDVALNDPHVAAHNNERHLINSMQDLSDPTFKANLEGSFVSTDEESLGLHVDLERPVNPAMRWAQYEVHCTITGDFIATLGAPPLGGVLNVKIKTAGQPLAPLLPSSYSVEESVITISDVLAGDDVVIEYFYDSDQPAADPTITHNQFDLYDTFNRTVASTTIGANLGPAMTGQSAQIFLVSGWKIEDGYLTKSSAGTGSSDSPSGDCLYWQCTSPNGWLETVLVAGGTAPNPAGLAFRGLNSTERLHLTTTQIQTRIAGTPITRAVFSAFAHGDGQGVLMNGNVFEVYRRSANIGPWVRLLTYTLPTSLSDTAPGLLTNTRHGLRNASDDFVANVTKFDYIKFIAGATSPPAVS